MKIAHVSDIHIRNLKFHGDYRKVFDDFYQKLRHLEVDLVVNTGDTAHTKTNISPEFVSMCSDFLTNVAKICPIVSALGNHDLNLMNADREDAITPIVEALADPNIILLKKSGPYPKLQGAELLGPEWNHRAPFVRFWNFGIADVEHWPRSPYAGDAINVGLFHGSIKNCLTDSNFRMTNVEYDTDIFEGLDFVMMGDIHKRQSFNDGRAWYAGSMIQQNFGEDPDKGFLLWNIRSKTDFDVQFHELRGNRRFYTVKLPDDLRLPDADIDPDSRVRISPPRVLTLVEHKAIEKLARKKWSPHDVIILGAQNIGQMFAEVDGKSHRIENLRDVSVQESLLKQFLAARKLDETVVNKVLDMNRKYQVAVEQKEDTARGVAWRVLKMGWNNIYNYGEGNVIDLSQIKGTTGLFAPNASGKSGLVDVITIGLWDANTKEVPKNVHLINDNKDHAIIILEVLANGERYTIQRELERIKQPQKVGPDKAWGKTTLDFVRHDRDGGLEKLVGEQRPQTEANIRRRIGNFDDFMLTGLFAQWDPMDLIMCKETDRKRILFRFLDLDIFEGKAKLAKDEAREWMDRLVDLEGSNYEALRDQLQEEQSQDTMQLVSWESLKSGQEEEIARVHEEIESLNRQIIPVNFVFRKIEPQALAALERKIEDAQGRATLASLDVAGYEGDVKNLERAQARFDVSLISEKTERLEEFEAVLFSLQASVKEHRRHVDERLRQVSLLDKVPCGDQFPGCQFLVDAFRANRELPSHRAEIKDIEAEARKIQEEVDGLKQFRAQRDEREAEITELGALQNKLSIQRLQCENANLLAQKLEAELGQVKLELERYEQVKRDLEKNDVIQSEITKFRDDLVARERGLKDFEKQLAELHQRMGARKTDIDRLEKQIATTREVRDTCSAYEHFLDAMGKDGIALQVLTQKLPLINEEINKILTSAAEFGVFIEYDKEDQSIRIYIQYGQYKSRILELGSGAEKFLASVAIRSALLSISNLPRSNMFIIDEGFGKLDPQNLEAVQRMFDYLKSVFDHVIVISHTDVMKDLVDNTIEIAADDEGYAHVEVGG